MVARLKLKGRPYGRSRSGGLPSVSSQPKIVVPIDEDSDTPPSRPVVQPIQPDKKSYASMAAKPASAGQPIHQRVPSSDKLSPISWITSDTTQRLNETFAYHTTTMANTLELPILVFTQTGNMPMLLSHYRPEGQIFAFTDSDVVRRRLALYHAITALHCEFTDTSDNTINKALSELGVRALMKSGDSVVVVQSSSTSAWGFECNHAIMLYEVP
eukprot:TRINITY_DN9036_c0_g1_i3.p1 TRINITY_DN9036_c0_g1~~TRINITY_DN9036_c0_g1_i3.p1  ORF type:complete len:222 (+),score=22.57 TRINITY_DN9036_c0_g1_i3:26-667(+)